MKLVARLALGAALLGFAVTAIIMIVLHEGNEPKLDVKRPPNDRRRFSGADSDFTVIPTEPFSPRLKHRRRIETPRSKKHRRR